MDATQQNQKAPKSTNNNRPHLTTPELIHKINEGLDATSMNLLLLGITPILLNDEMKATCPEEYWSLVGRMREFSRLMSKTNHEIISHLEKISPKKTEQ